MKDNKFTKGHRQRTFTEFIENKSGDTNEYKLLEILLYYPIKQKDTKHIAKNLLIESKNIAKLSKQDLNSIGDIHGFGKISRKFLNMFFELSKRYKNIKLSKSTKHEEEIPIKQFILSSKRFFNDNPENLMVLYIDYKQNYIHHEIIKDPEILKNSEKLYRQLLNSALTQNVRQLALIYYHKFSPPSGIKSIPEKLAMNNIQNAGIYVIFENDTIKKIKIK